MGIVEGGFLGSLSLCVSLIFLLSPFSCYASGSYLFVFGDSLYDPGNNAISMPNCPSAKCPYGMTYIHHPTGRFSDGRTVPDFIASKMNLSFIPPIQDTDADFKNGASFASAGAAISDDSTYATNLPGQYINFSNLVKNWTKDKLNQAVYLISIGGNDYFAYADPVHDKTDTSFGELRRVVAEVIAKFTKVIKDMYDLGARKFMFQTVGPIGCLPMIQEKYNISQACARLPITLATLHNNALYEMVESIKNSDGYSQFTYSIFDYYTLLGERIRVPEKYGFIEGDKPCYNGSAPNPSQTVPNSCDCIDSSGLKCTYNGTLCSNPDSYVFFDGGHNTDTLNYQLSYILWNGERDYVYPYTMKQLVELNPTALKLNSSN